MKVLKSLFLEKLTQQAIGSENSSKKYPSSSRRAGIIRVHPQGERKAEENSCRRNNCKYSPSRISRILKNPEILSPPPAGEKIVVPVIVKNRQLSPLAMQGRKVSELLP
jgi:hypothetical protein